MRKPRVTIRSYQPFELFTEQTHKRCCLITATFCYLITDNATLHREEDLRDPAQAVSAAEPHVLHRTLAGGAEDRGGARVSEAQRHQAAGGVVILLSR
jgi:hypothetical protein